MGEPQVLARIVVVVCRSHERCHARLHMTRNDMANVIDQLDNSVLFSFCLLV